MHIIERISMVLVVLLYNSLVLKCRHFDFFDPYDIISFTWPKNYLSKNCRARPPVSSTVYRLSLPRSVFEISAGGGYPPPPPPSVPRWPRRPTVHGLNSCTRIYLLLSRQDV